MTFSIAASDLDNDDGPEWGVAVASKFLAVGAVVPWARAGAGAVATQAFANVSYGPRGLDRLARGQSAADVIRALTDGDEGRSERQLGIVDASGDAATFTGDQCFDWAGGRIGPGFCCQGNILTGPEVIDEMVTAFESSTGPLAHRLIAALRAGDRAGGDKRGKQSAALLVVREAGGYGGTNDKALELRVDDHPEAAGELSRLLELHDFYFPPPGDVRLTPIDRSLADELRDRLGILGYEVAAGTGYDEGLRQALYAYSGAENLEERWSEGAEIDLRVLEFIRRASP